MTFPAPRLVPDVGPPPLDGVLVERIRAGDVAAFETLFTVLYPSLCGFVESYVRSDAIAEDLVADLFRRLWERREHWAPTTSATSYLFGAARNRALDHLKRERVELRVRENPALAVRPPGMGAPSPGPEAELAAAELDAAIERAIEALPERRRLAFTLRRRHHLSYAEIAEVMGIAVKTVDVQIGLAIKSLRKSLSEWIE